MSTILANLALLALHELLAPAKAAVISDEQALAEVVLDAEQFCPAMTLDAARATTTAMTAETFRKRTFDPPIDDSRWLIACRRRHANELTSTV
jgi:hypothetical protein